MYKIISGFEVPRRYRGVPDYIVCVKSEEEIDTARKELNYIGYIRLKLKWLQAAHRKDVEENGENGDILVFMRFHYRSNIMNSLRLELEVISEEKNEVLYKGVDDE